MDGRLGDLQAAGDLPLPSAQFMVKTKDILDSTHG
jgi:hypothetical protein